ncbi:MAG: hypothetical protein RI907_2390 [Pseudomonadota bacterium]|jgi:monoamine oxidase
MSTPQNARRRWIGRTATSLAALPTLSALGTGPAQSATVASARGSYTTEVAVLGAGYAGLACARSLVAAGKQVLVVEGRDRVGGRCWNQPLPAPYDKWVVAAGAQFLGPTQERMYALCAEFGLQTSPIFDTGRLVNLMNGRRTTYKGVLPTANPLALLSAGTALLNLDNLAAKLPPDTPWTASNAVALDSMSVQTWIDKNVGNKDARNLLRVAVLALLSTEPASISMLHFLWYARMSGGLTLLLSTTGGAQQDQVVGGSQLIAQGMARSLGERILYNAGVKRVTQSAQGVRIEGDGFSVQAQRVVVAMSPAMAQRIDFQPLDGAMQVRTQLMQRVPMGSVWKAFAVYERPFWRDAGLNGQVTSDDHITKVTFDSTPPGEGAPGVMLGFIEGQDAIDASLMSAADRKAAVIKAFTAYFGNEAASPKAYLEVNWQAEAYSQGGYTGVCPPGVLTQFKDVWRQAIGRVHWAGTETATAWSGYMEGAVRSGERAAQEVLNA